MPHTGMRLVQLEIEDFGLIARGSLEFADGFTVCTGETGSGKTMLLGALSFVLGGRSSADAVRSGAARARVTLALRNDAALRARLTDGGFDNEDDDALLVREMLANGKSTARINGRLATTAQLRALGEFVVEEVGQHEQQRLLSRAYQLDVLDRYAGEAALAARERVRATFERARALDAELHELLGAATRAGAELDFARFAAERIAAAALTEDEDAALRERRDYLSNLEKIQRALAGAHETLAGRDGSAIETLGAAAASLAAVARYAPALETLAVSVAALQSDANDAAIAVSRELDAGELDPSELEAVTARLDLIEGLKKQYGGTIRAVLAAGVRYEETIARENNRDAREAGLHASLADAQTTLAREAEALGELRVAAARVLEERVAGELSALAMPAARFAVVIEALREPGPAGTQSVEFALSPNPGEPLRTLGRAASGGELSRVLLALVVVLADRRERTALVFDEIDAGIGGATATAVGVRIGALALASQVLCVTHLAQIASWADTHYALRKRTVAESTVIDIVPLLERRDVLDEIARMLSGSTAAVALEHAETLVRDASRQKRRRATV